MPGTGLAQQVADLARLAGDHEAHAAARQLVIERAQHLGGGEVDGGHGLEVQHDGSRAVSDVAVDGRMHVVRVDVEQLRFRPDDDDVDAEHRVGVPLDIDPVLGSGLLGEDGDVRARGAMDDQEHGHADPDEETGKGVEDQHPSECRHRGDEVGPRGVPIDLTERAGVEPVEPDEGPVAHDEVLRRAERGVGHQRGERRVQIHDRRHPCDRGVGKRLRHENGQTVRPATRSPDSQELL
jgi:hypothetical protein